MRKSALAVLALLAGAIAANTASPASAATNASPLTAGPKVTITVSCPQGEYPVDYRGQYSCAAAKHAHHVREVRHVRHVRHARHGKRSDRTRHHRKLAATAPARDECQCQRHGLWQSPYFHFWNWGHTGHMRWGNAG
jgi:hypothetical protein